MTRRVDLVGVWLELEKACGSVGELAKRIGVSRVTVWRWSRGVKPAAIVQRHVNAFAKSNGVDAPFPEQGP